MLALQGGTRSFEAGLDGGRTVVVETHPVDHGTVLDQAEEARLFISGLGLAGDGAHFDVAEAEFREGFDAQPLLVEPGGEAERGWERDTEGSGLQGRRGCREPLEEPPCAGGVGKPDPLESDLVGAFGVHP